MPGAWQGPAASRRGLSRSGWDMQGRALGDSRRDAWLGGVCAVPAAAMIRAFSSPGLPVHYFYPAVKFYFKFK